MRCSNEDAFLALLSLSVAMRFHPNSGSLLDDLGSASFLEELNSVLRYANRTEVTDKTFRDFLDRLEALDTLGTVTNLGTSRGDRLNRALVLMLIARCKPLPINSHPTVGFDISTLNTLLDDPDGPATVVELEAHLADLEREALVRFDSLMKQLAESWSLTPEEVAAIDPGQV